MQGSWPALHSVCKQHLPHKASHNAPLALKFLRCLIIPRRLLYTNASAIHRPHTLSLSALVLPCLCLSIMLSFSFSVSLHLFLCLFLLVCWQIFLSYFVVTSSLLSCHISLCYSLSVTVILQPSPPTFYDQFLAQFLSFLPGAMTCAVRLLGKMHLR